MTPSEFIDQIINDGIPLSPWIPPTFENDFILLSEFSELEGPKPLLTIPEIPANSSFNLNAFSVRIMSADCVSIMQAEDFADFKPAGDMKVVLTELREGAVAYVHHFALYDICARGYVRPFCLAYITNNSCALMNIFDKLLRYFTAACLLIRFGNAISFLSDLLIRLDHLTELCRVIQSESVVIIVDGQPIKRSEKAMINELNINDIKKQLLDLRNAFYDYINCEEFADHRSVFSTQYETISLRIRQFDSDCKTTDQETESNAIKSHSTDLERLSNGPTDMADDLQQPLFYEPTDPDDGIASYEFPSDVIACVLGKRYFKALRPLHDLCMSTFPLAFEILKSSLDAKYRMSKHENLPAIKSYKSESVSSQNYEILFCGVEFPVLTVYTQGDQSVCCSSIDTENFNLSPLKLETFLAEFHNKQRNKLEDTKKQLTCVGSPKKYDHSYLSNLQPDTISSPMCAFPKSKTSQAMGLRETKEGFLILEDTTSCPVDEKVPSDEGSCDSFKDAYSSTPYSSSLHSLNSNKTSSPEPSMFHRSVSTGTNGEDSHHMAVSPLNMQKCARVSLLSLRKKFSFLSHVAYSLFLKRPVVIIAEEKQRPRVRKLVYCLTNFIPLHSGLEKRIIPWCNSPLNIEDLKRLSLVGISKSTKTNPVPFSLRSYITLLDYENQTLTAPLYDGSFLSNVFDQNQNFHSEQVFRDFIRQKFAEMLSLAYVHFAVVHLQSGKFSIGGPRQQKVYSSGFRPYKYLSNCDTNIVRELSNCFVELLATPNCKNAGGCYDKCIKLNLLKCSLFTNKIKKR